MSLNLVCRLDLGDLSSNYLLWTVAARRDPRWGRNEEGCAEDPLLTGVMATAYVGGLRGARRDGQRRGAGTDGDRRAHVSATGRHCRGYTACVARDPGSAGAATTMDQSVGQKAR